MSKPTGQQVVDRAKKAIRKADGGFKPYIFGYEVNLDDPNPKAFDCSELVEYVCYQLGIKPKVPDGASAQYEFCKGNEISMDDALTTPGALFFRISSAGNHVIFSQGNGKSVEAKGKDYGCGEWEINTDHFTNACLIPGVDYGTGWEDV